jgi:hypothetical protein
MDTSFNSTKLYLDFFATEYFVCYNSGWIKICDKTF